MAYGHPGGYPGQPHPYGAQQPYGGVAPHAPVMGAGPPPGVDPAVYQWFITVDQDRTGQISAVELQQALTNANWSHFNAETCRLMIGMFDRDMSGQIDVNEFQALWTYIHQWRGIFDQFDRDRSGSIDFNEFHAALNQLGYKVSPQFAHLVVVRYDNQARSRLTLDNFIQACVLLKSVTDTFKQRDNQMTGVIHVSYEDFMCMAMLNKP